MDSAVLMSTRMSAAQRCVLVAVTRREEALADALAETLGTSPSAVRQHLVVLKSGGFVASRREQGSSGRPIDLYHCIDMDPEEALKLLLQSNPAECVVEAEKN